MVQNQRDEYGLLEIEVHMYEAGTKRFLGCCGYQSGLICVNKSGVLYQTEAYFQKSESNGFLTYDDVKNKDIYLTVIEDDVYPCPQQDSIPSDELVGRSLPFSGRNLEAPQAMQFGDVKRLVIGLQPTAVTSSQQSDLADSFDLRQNHPNPFNPSTTITYALPQQVEVKLIIFDMLGRHVRTLVNQRQQAGRYAITWDGRNENGQAVASGTFIYQLHAGTFVQTRRMALVR